MQSFEHTRFLLMMTVVVSVAGSVGGCGKRSATGTDDTGGEPSNTDPNDNNDKGKDDQPDIGGDDDTTPTTDTAPPDIATATAITHTSVRVVFSETVNGTSVVATAFHIQGVSSTVAVQSAELGGDGRTVTLTVDAGMHHGEAYTLLVQGVSDLAGNTIVSATKVFTGRGAVVAELSGTPSSLTNVAGATINVSGADIVAYQYALTDTAHVSSWSAELSTSNAIALTGLADGAYSLQVVGKDSLGNWQSYTDATTVHWAIDTVAPVALFASTPAALTSSTSASFVVSGDGVIAYKALLDSGSWASEVDVAGKLELSGLAEGPHVVAVIGRDQAGNWQAEGDAHSFTWTVDTNASTAVLTGLPANPTKVTSLDVAVGGSGVATYVYTLDGSDWSAATDVSELITATDLTDGEHTLVVIGSDAAGNPQDAPTSYTWTIDTVPPVATLSSVPSNPTSSTSTHILVGGADVVSYVYRLGGGATSGVHAASGTLDLTGLSEGLHELEVFAADAAGNWQTVPTVLAWVVDTTAPVAVLSALPPLTNATDATLTVSGADVTGYKYRLDSGAWSTESATTTAITVTGLADGAHVVAVVGRDAAGNWQSLATATTVGWTVDTVPPVATLNGLPPELTSSTSLDVTVAGCVSYRVSLDGSSWSGVLDVTVPITATGLADGNHSLAVVGADAAGNWQTTSTTYAWGIDATAPSSVTLANVPADPSNDAAPQIDVTGAEVVTYSYALDSGAWSAFVAIATPITLALGEGSHTLYVVGRDHAGNVQAAPTTITWIVDLTPPVVTLSGVPAALTNVNTASIGVVGADFYSRRLDGGAYATAVAATDPIVLAGLSDGAHTLDVLGLDLAGNWQVAPTSITWTVDRTPPAAPAVNDLIGSNGGLGVHSSDLSLTFAWTSPSDAAETAIQVATDSAFTNIVFGGANGASVGTAQSYDYVVDPNNGAVYFARVRVRDLAQNWSAFGNASDGIDVVGGVSGKIQNSNLANVSGATVTLQLANGNSVATTTSNASGVFSFDSVRIGTTAYKLLVAASGYGNATKGNISVGVGATTDIGIVYLVSSSASPGTITGTVVDANAGAKVTGATVKILDWTGATAGTLTTATSNGGFTSATLTPGTYTLLISKVGFFDLQIDNVVLAGNVNVGQQALCQVLAEPQVRVVLLWGAAPADLDLHVVGPTAKAVTVDGAPSDRFHVYWNNRKSFDENTGNYTAGADPSGASSTTSLVQDDTNSYGPEAINLFGHGVGYPRGVYTFTVHNYSSTNWYAAPITLRIYDSQGLVQELPIPNGGGSDGYWRAFKIDIQGPSRAQRTVTVSNTFAAAPNNSWNSKSTMNW